MEFSDLCYLYGFVHQSRLIDHRIEKLVSHVQLQHNCRRADDRISEINLCDNDLFAQVKKNENFQQMNDESFENLCFSHSLSQMRREIYENLTGKSKKSILNVENSRFFSSRSVLFLYFIPSALYCLYNNLSFINLSSYDPTTYFLLLQFRVVVTGVIFQV